MQLQRIIWHWSAGSYTISDDSREHYHFMVDGDAVVQTGFHTPEDNLKTGDGDYAAHVRAFNTGSIGLSILAMGGAVERPFDAGRWPIKPEQVEGMVIKTVELCRRYDISVGRSTTLSHAEVEPTCGIDQAGKWDIMWLPGMFAPADPVDVGDMLRTMVEDAMRAPPPAPPIVVPQLEEQLAALNARVQRLEGLMLSAQIQGAPV